jgi:hypothetical protein
MKASYDTYRIVVECRAYPTTNFLLNTANISGDSSICVLKKNQISNQNLSEINKIQSFGNIDEDFDSYGADKISQEVINSSVSLVEKINQFNKNIYFVAPGVNGEVSLEMKSGSRNLEILVYPQKKYKYVFFEGNNFKSQGALNSKELSSIINLLSA